MRLIDADKLKTALIKHFDAYFNDKGQLVYSDHICTSDDVNDLFGLIDKQLIAYDVDKVVEQLKNVSYERFGNAGMGGENVVNLDDAIEIVKAGGIDDKK